MRHGPRCVMMALSGVRCGWAAQRDILAIRAGSKDNERCCVTLLGQALCGGGPGDWRDAVGCTMPMLLPTLLTTCAGPAAFTLWQVVQ
jgi:hypothetical protein